MQNYLRARAVTKQLAYIRKVAMRLYSLQHSVNQNCPACADNCLVLYVYADSPQEAATSKDTLCAECMRLGNGIEDAIAINIRHPWYGVDLDGTLAETVDAEHIMEVGKPIIPMVERVQQMLREGKEVRIFTARVACSNAYSTWAARFDDSEFMHHQIQAIERWCFKNIGVILPITAVKDFACVEIYDDCAKQVVRNTGKLIEDEFNKSVVGTSAKSHT
jgi:hypothetical protein